MDRVGNDKVRERLGQESILNVVQRRQNRWLEKLNEMDNKRLVKMVYEGEVEGRRPRGRPRKNGQTILSHRHCKPAHNLNSDTSPYSFQLHLK